MARAWHRVQGWLWHRGSYGRSCFVICPWCVFHVHKRTPPSLAEEGGRTMMADWLSLVIPQNPPMGITPWHASALLEPPYPDSTMGSPMWLPGSHTLSNPHPNLRSSSFHRFVLSLWEPDASHLFQCQMKLNICSFQGLWLAINKLANKDLVCWEGVCVACRRVGVYEGGMQEGI